MKKIIITGANSFIGRSLVRSIPSQWNIISVIGKSSETNNIEQYSDVTRISMEDYAQLKRIAGKCDCFVHLAWRGTRGENRANPTLQQQNINESLRAINIMLYAGCPKIVLAGSQAEYGLHYTQISEESVCVPNTEYGKAKLQLYYQTMQLCAQCGASVIEPRLFSIYGPDDFQGTLIMSLLEKMRKNLPCDLTECRQMWDFLYLDDAADALMKLCTGDCPSGIYNLGNGDCHPLHDFILKIADLLHTNSELKFGSIPYPATGMVSLWPDVRKIKSTIDWTPKTTFEEGIKKILHKIRTKEAI